MFQPCNTHPGTLASMSTPAETFPGATLGLPAAGRGSLAPWGRRIAALVADWALAMGLAVLFFGTSVLRDSAPRSFLVLGVFFVVTSGFVAACGSTPGQLLARIGVTRIDGEPLGFWRPIVRQALICLVIPTVVIGAERRALNDLMLGTVVVRR